jgi:serine/threonine protein kinase
MNLTLNFDDSEEMFISPAHQSQKKRAIDNLIKYNTFIAKLKNIPKYRKGNKKGSKYLNKYNDCPIKIIKDGKRGASGVLDIKLNTKFLYRETHLIKSNMLETKMFNSFYFPRLQKYCKDITKYVTRTSKLFPNNFLKIKDCKYCIFKKKEIDDVKISYMMQNASFNKKTSDNLDDDMHKVIYSFQQLGSLFCQIYYISVVCNRKGMFHNDLKPANIVINKARKNFVYNGLGNIKIYIKKGDLIPIFVDYDLISFKKFDILQGDHPASGTSYDFSFFKDKAYTKAGDPKHLFLDENFPDFDERINSIKLKLIFKDFVNIKRQ